MAFVRVPEHAQSKGCISNVEFIIRKRSLCSLWAALLILGLQVGDAGIDLWRLLGRDLLVAGAAEQLALVGANRGRVEFAAAGIALEATLVELAAVWKKKDLNVQPFSYFDMRT